MYRDLKSRPKPSLTSGLVISAATTLIILFAIEKFAEGFLASPYHWDARLMLFSEGDVFQNRSWGGFTYQPNAKITERAVYITDPKRLTLVDEYQYEVRTNSAGLVQLADVNKTIPSIMFLGDSYTEGQGALPWFYALESSWKKYSSFQIINGGMLGTGFEAWLRLYKHLAQRANIKKLVVIYISSDWTRAVWNISDHDLHCLKQATRCDGENNFLGLPANSADAENQIHRIAVERVDYVAHSRNFLEASAVYQRLLHPAYLRWWPYRRSETEAQFERSKDAIRQMTEAIGRENIIFIQLPQKDELMLSTLDSLSERGRSFIRQTGLKYVDGSKECGLTIEDFHIHDGHPNSAGYRKILDCVEGAVKGAFAPL
jgi:hypothetical protein